MFKKTLMAVLIAATTATSLTPMPAFSQNRAPIAVDDEGDPQLPRRKRIVPAQEQENEDGQQIDRRRPFAPDNTPSATQIERSLDAAPRMRVRPQDRVNLREFKRRPDLRRSAPSIEIQSINFDFGSALVPRDQYDKVERIADGMRRVLRRNRAAVFLIEGHTDAVGSYSSNEVLSERRAASLRTVLVRDFGVPSRALETVGYGEEFLLVNTQNEEWRNRRVTLRRIDAFIR